MNLRRSITVIMVLAAIVAGVTAATSRADRFTLEPNLDRSGNDLRKDELAADATVDACADRCLATTGCAAFTFVKRSTTVPAPICWLKATVPTGYPSECCISGVLKK